MAVVFHQEVSIVARGSRNRDAVRRIQCLDVEPMMSLTEVVGVVERATNEPRQNLHDFQDSHVNPVNQVKSCNHVKVPDHSGSR